ncbi:two-component system sensor protein [Sorangium cellulosum]|uniref:histidine kinase n=1 Tax=Sorangium cellulosum TaxID=56 RepID=A0A2L0ERP9_SORCE|nr:HAMP domain-containing sensor histidine kinase [Sorangium cellulosum]AUX41973.1 two-component system sensor protein [Sorangium cellulosum]
MWMDDEFFGRVGHDLRGELATMLAGIHYLLRYQKDLGAGSRDMLERVRGAGERLKRLLDEFDNAVWLREDASRPMSIARCDAVELVRRAAAHLEELAAARGVHVSLDAEPEGATMIEGDPELLRVALEYVLGFAILRSRDRPVTIRVARAEGGPVVTVVDEAGPVSPEPLARLLDPFGERAAIPADPVAPRRRERLGLGLAIARGILDAHGGGLTVEPSTERLDGGAPASAADMSADGLRFTCTLGGIGGEKRPELA